jgi:hypothetical protein
MGLFGSGLSQNGLSFGLQTQTSVRHMLVSTEDLRFWRPGGKVLVLGPAH